VGLYGRPLSLSASLEHRPGRSIASEAGNHKGPLAPTDNAAFYLSSWLRVMRIGADESAVGAIPRPLHGHPELCHAERSEASLCPARQMLHCAQHDRAGTTMDGRMNLVISIIAPTG
jgi:hypothetical protein